MNRPVLLTLSCTVLLIACSEVSGPMPPLAEANATPIALTATEQASHGRYLVEIMGCGDCHSPKTMGPQGPAPDATRLMSGHPSGTALPPMPTSHAGWVLSSMDQTAMVGPWGTSFAANLTSDATGIGNWSEEQFIRAMTHGLNKGMEGSRALLPPMPWQNYRNMKTDDLKAIFAYLRSTPPVENVVPAPLPPAMPQ
ncbi:MAG: diheme cytochrome c-553 [Flavobacteriales bacterium]